MSAIQTSRPKSYFQCQISFFVIIASTFFLIFYHSSIAIAKSKNINDTCNQIVSELNDKVLLSGKKVQVSENNFWERDTLINQPFSKVLGESLAKALSDFGAIVTVQEVGTSPLKLIGNYAFENGQVILSIRLRMMGENASEDKAVAIQTMAKDMTEPEWFEPKFDRVSRTIVRLLEDNYSQFYTVNIKKIQFKPGLFGQAPLLFGREFARYFKSALATASVFSSSEDSPLGQITGTYTVIEDRDTPKLSKMDLVVDVIEDNGNLLSSTNFSIPLFRIPKTLLTPMAEKPTIICLLYSSRSSKYIESNSDIVSTLMELVGEALAKHGLQSIACKPGKTDGLKIEITLQAREKSKGQGFKLLSGTLKLKATRDSKTIGSISKKIKMLFKNDFEGALEKSIEKLFSKSKTNKDLAKLILGRNPS